MSFSKNSCAWHEEEAGDSYAQQMPPRQQSDLRQALAEVQHQRQGVRRQQWRQRRSNDGQQTQDAYDEVAAPERPVQRVVLIFAWLRHKDNAVSASLDVRMLRCVSEFVEVLQCCRSYPGALAVAAPMTGRRRTFVHASAHLEHAAVWYR